MTFGLSQGSMRYVWVTYIMGGNTVLNKRLTIQVRELLVTV